MEARTGAFFYTIRAWGCDRVILSLTESHAPLNNWSLRAVLKAREKREAVNRHVADLVFMAAKGQYSRFEIETPSEVASRLYRRQGVELDGNTIKNNLVKKLKRRRKK